MLSHLKFSPAKSFLSTDITNHAFDSYILIQESNKNSDYPHFINELIQTQIFIEELVNCHYNRQIEKQHTKFNADKITDIIYKKENLIMYRAVPNPTKQTIPRANQPIENKFNKERKTTNIAKTNNHIPPTAIKTRNKSKANMSLIEG